MFVIGARVELDRSTETWERGDRYGEITQVIRGTDHVWYGVRLDKSRQVRFYHTLNIAGAA